MGSSFAFGLGFLLVALASYGANGQQQDTCISKLVPCAQYLNATTKPPDTCCNPLRDAITNDLACLCRLYADPTVFKAFTPNITQALGLPKLCGITSGGLDECNKAPSPTPGGPTPTGTSGGSNSACGLAWIGISGLTGLFLLWASIMV